MELFEDVTEYSSTAKTINPTSDNMYSASVQQNPLRDKINKILDIQNIEFYGV